MRFRRVVIQLSRFFRSGSAVIEKMNSGCSHLGEDALLIEVSDSLLEHQLHGRDSREISWPRSRLQSPSVVTAARCHATLIPRRPTAWGCGTGEWTRRVENAQRGLGVARGCIGGWGAIEGCAGGCEGWGLGGYWASTVHETLITPSTMLPRRRVG